jgi:nucleotide-binding universal stress UspA family protein
MRYSSPGPAANAGGARSLAPALRQSRVRLGTQEPTVLGGDLQVVDRCRAHGAPPVGGRLPEISIHGRLPRTDAAGYGASAASCCGRLAIGPARSRPRSGAHPMPLRCAARDPASTPRVGRTMRGTILCWVDDSPHGRAALRAAVDLSDRLKLRLVLAHVASGGDDAGDDEDEPRTRRREGAARLVERLASEHRLSDRTERRSAVGDPATLLGQMAAEEAADLIVIGAPARARLRRSSESRLAEHLESTTMVPVVLVPQRSRGQSPWNAAGATVD